MTPILNIFRFFELDIDEFYELFLFLSHQNWIFKLVLIEMEVALLKLFKTNIIWSL